MDTSPLVPEALGDVRVCARVALAAVSVTLEELAALEPGRVLRLGLAVETAAELVVNGVFLAHGEIVSSGGRRAFVLEEIP